MSYILGRYITEEGLKNIKNHEYKAGEYSPLDKLINPYWIMISEWLPRWMAPNLVTFIGLVALAGAYCCMMIYDLSMTEPLPRWTYLGVAVGIFVFQTLDAIDGKQARRTNSSSPLGQLFDHGCDALSWTICCMSIISFLQLGMSLKSIFTIYSGIGAFYTFNLIEYYTGVFLYTVGVIDGTTAQFLLILFNTLAFFYGGEFYDTKLSDQFTFLPEYVTRDFEMRDLVLLIVVYVGVLFSVILVFKVFEEIKDFKTKVKAALQLLQHYGIYVLMYMYNDDIKFVKDNAALAYFSVIFLFSLVVTKMIVCTMAKMDFAFIHLEYLVFVPYFYFQSQYDGTAESENLLKYSFYATFVVIFGLYLRFVQCCINQLTDYLGIYCFKIGARKTKQN